MRVTYQKDVLFINMDERFEMDASTTGEEIKFSLYHWIGSHLSGHVDITQKLLDEIQLFINDVN